MVQYGPWELHAGHNCLRLEEICYSPEDAQISPCNTILHIKVVSGEFSGRGEFECDWADLLRFVSGLNELYHFEHDEVEFRDIEMGAWLKFCMKRTGHLTISGHLYGGTPLHALEFEFWTDQTVLGPFLQQIMKQLAKP